VDACRVPPGKVLPNGARNELSFTAIRPGGRNCYPAIWVQDFTMIFASGFVTVQDGLDHLELILRCQNGGSTRTLKSGARLPPHAIPDHINFDGTPVFFPGTYSSGDDQGGEPWGVTPPHGNHFDVIWLAHMLAQVSRRHDFLLADIHGLSVYQRLQHAYQVPTTDPKTGLVYTIPEQRAVGFIFCDSVYMTGLLLMASLLRIRASRQLAGLAATLGHKSDAASYLEQAKLTAKNIRPTFAGTGRYRGWLMAATGTSSQPDVWATIYSIYLNILDEESKRPAIETILSAIRDGDIEENGALRHVPIKHDASKSTAWERSLAPHNRYQNGAFWHMPTGWLVAILKEQHPDQAESILGRYLTHMRDHAFTMGNDFCAPWECIGWNGEACQNPVFGPSVTVPYSVLAGLERKT